MQIKIKVKHNLSLRELSADSEMKLSDLRMMVQEMTEVEEADQMLMLNERVLLDDKKTLDQLGFRDGTVVVLRTKKSRAPVPASQSSSQTDLLRNPFVQNLMKNPEGMRSMMSMFPGLENEINKNEELRQMVNNPNFAEEMNRLAADPEYFNQQAKNADVAMARLETLPGGLNMINSMVRDVNDPLSRVVERGLQSPDIRGGHHVREAVRDAVPNPNVSVNWLVVYRKQIHELSRFGFTDIQRNLIALKHCKGNLSETILFLTNE